MMAPPFCGTANASVDSLEETAVLQKYSYETEHIVGKGREQTYNID